MSTVRSVFFQKKKHMAGFTLVEIMVVIGILSVLGTIGILSLQGYLSSTRDAARLENLVNLRKGLVFYRTKTGIYPMPESPVTITASGVTIGYQGFAKNNIASIAKVSSQSVVDLLNPDMFITYSINVDQSRMQMMGFFENYFPGSTVDTSNSGVIDVAPFSFHLPDIHDLGEDRSIMGISTSFAASNTDYSARYLKTIGDNLGILIAENATGSLKNQPIQENTDIITTGSLDIRRTQNRYRALFIDMNDAIAGTGTNLQGLQFSYANGAGTSAPSYCPVGYIPIPGNKEFNQPGFCVMKYEAKALGGIPDPPVYGMDWNTHTYMTGDIIVSNARDVPLSSLPQSKAIALCKSMGPGYHLITNNEWMTIARNIEAQSVNWSTNMVGSGYIYAGNSGINTRPVVLDAGSLLTASSDDSDGYYQIGLTTGKHRRTFFLSNGQVIWDLSGNQPEHVNKGNSIDGEGFNVGQLSVWNWWSSENEWLPSIDLNFRAIYGPSSYLYTTSQGIGRFYNPNGVTSNVLIRGGTSGYAYDDPDNKTGLYAMHLGYDDTVAWAASFRCARW